ncbi:hypothetical protein FSP39_004690 [Pinctada imbricata]|uniref:PID domain-containing protein n=1 Tax=Pinctada imbricata TaxID=66713 RepID=A0AA88XYR2_PINIB|nr:hypothetical protein FSP39_004690 [Pinctada imbricata]
MDLESMLPTRTQFLSTRTNVFVNSYQCFYQLVPNTLPTRTQLMPTRIITTFELFHYAFRTNCHELLPKTKANKEKPPPYEKKRTPNMGVRPDTQEESASPACMQHPSLQFGRIVTSGYFHFGRYNSFDFKLRRIDSDEVIRKFWIIDGQHIVYVSNSSSTENIASITPSPNKDHVMMQKNKFTVYYLGMIQNMHMGNSRKRDSEAQLIDQVEEAQIEGKLPATVSEDAMVHLFITRHGVEVVDSNREVLQRHPLHTIAQVIQYEDGFGKPNIAMKIGQLQVTRGAFHCYIFQCTNEEHALAICQSIRQIFDAITGKT